MIESIQGYQMEDKSSMLKVQSFLKTYLLSTVYYPVQSYIGCHCEEVDTTDEAISKEQDCHALRARNDM